MKVTVLGAHRFNFSNQKNEVITGCKVTYIEEPENDENKKGYHPMTISGDYSLFNKLTQVPAVYEMDFSMKPDRNGRPIMVLKDLNFVRQIKISEIGAA